MTVLLPLKCLILTSESKIMGHVVLRLFLWRGHDLVPDGNFFCLFAIAPFSRDMFTFLLNASSKDISAPYPPWKEILKTAVLDMSKLFLLDFLLLMFAPILPGDFPGMTSRKPCIVGTVALILASALSYFLSCPSTAVISLLFYHPHLTTVVPFGLDTS